MKKILLVVLSVLMIASSMAVPSFAGTINVDLSMTESIQAAPGDEITVDVFVDSNSGIASACLIMKYDTRYFSLSDVENGEIFNDGDLEINPKDNGSFMFMAINMGTWSNITKTGKLFSVKFKVLKTAYNGEHIISIAHREDNSAGGGEGWFVDINDDKADVNIPIKNSTKITVSNSTVNPEDTEALKETTAPETGKQEETKAPTQGEPATDKVTADTKAPAADKEEEKATETTKKPVETILGEPVKPAETEAGKTYESEYVTDDNGETVLNENKDPELIYREVIEKDKVPENLNTIILIVSVCAVFAAGIIVAIVFVNNKKNKK